MSRNRKIGILLIFISLLIIAVYFISSRMVQTQEQDPNAEIQQNDSAVLSDESANDPVDEEAIEELNEGGEESADDAAIDNLNCNITEIDQAVEDDIADRNAFEYAIKRYLYENGFINKNVYSLDTVTIRYRENNKLYLLGIEDENQYFYVVYDMNTGLYSAEEY